MSFYFAESYKVLVTERSVSVCSLVSFSRFDNGMKPVGRYSK